MSRFQPQNRGEIRRSIGINLGLCKVGSATSTVDTSSLIDTKNLIGGDDEFNSQEVMIYETPTGSIVDGETSVVSDFAGSTSDATCAPVFTASITSGDKYEMWKTPWRIADINNVIDQAIIEATPRALVSRITTSNFTEDDKHEYDWLVPYAFGNDFKIVTKAEYAYRTDIEEDIHKCDEAWDESVDADVTTSRDTTFKKEGTASFKMVVAAGASAADILATDSITSTDLSLCTEIHMWIYSTVALAAGDLQVLLDNTASCASPVESLNIPATTANTWTRHVISLANPYNDSAIISVGIKMVVDKGAFTLWTDYIKAVNDKSVEYRELPLEYWGISEGTTPYFTLNERGLTLVRENRQMRLTGYAAPDVFSDDTTDCEIDPAYVIDWTMYRLLTIYAARFQSMGDRVSLADRSEARANQRLIGMTPTISWGREVNET